MVGTKQGPARPRQLGIVSILALPALLLVLVVGGVVYKEIGKARARADAEMRAEQLLAEERQRGRAEAQAKAEAAQQALDAKLAKMTPAQREAWHESRLLEDRKRLVEERERRKREIAAQMEAYTARAKSISHDSTGHDWLSASHADRMAYCQLVSHKLGLAPSYYYNQISAFYDADNPAILGNPTSQIAALAHVAGTPGN